MSPASSTRSRWDRSDSAFGRAVGFFLWSYALAKTTPTLVSLSITVNPIAAALVGWALMNEAIRPNLVAGIVLVFAGIAIATARPSVDSNAAARIGTPPVG